MAHSKPVDKEETGEITLLPTPVICYGMAHSKLVDKEETGEITLLPIPVALQEFQDIIKSIPKEEQIRYGVEPDCQRSSHCLSALQSILAAGCDAEDADRKFLQVSATALAAVIQNFFRKLVRGGKQVVSSLFGGFAKIVYAIADDKDYGEDLTQQQQGPNNNGGSGSGSQKCITAIDPSKRTSLTTKPAVVSKVDPTHHQKTDSGTKTSASYPSKSSSIEDSWIWKVVKRGLNLLASMIVKGITVAIAKCKSACMLVSSITQTKAIQEKKKEDEEEKEKERRRKMKSSSSSTGGNKTTRVKTKTKVICN